MGAKPGPSQRPPGSSFSTLASDGDSKRRPVGSARGENSNPPNAPPSTNRWTTIGFEHSLTEFATHVVVEQDEPMLLADLVDQVLEGVVRQNQQTMGTARATDTTADTGGAFLVELGSVWHLPHGGPARPELGGKPVRVVQPDFVVRKGDYVRIHHNPRRFRDVHSYDWAKADGSSSLSDDTDDDDPGQIRPGIVVAENATAGFLVINKPMRVPVHMTVDNCRENVQWCVKEARRQRRNNIASRSNGGVEAATNGDKMDDVDNVDEWDGGYVSTPQRLDQNTSGLLVVATSKAFANYFAGLLRHKTRRHVAEEPVAPGDPSMTQSEDRVESTSVHKLYRWYERLVPVQCLEGKRINELSHILRRFLCSVSSAFLPTRLKLPQQVLPPNRHNRQR
jgi:RNA pseudouridylate synthase